MRQQPAQIKPASGTQPNGIVRSYDARGWLLRCASYRDGRLDGPEQVFAAPGVTLFTVPLRLSDALERGELTPELRAAFAEQQIALPQTTRVTVVEPEREYLLLAPVGQSYTLRAIDGALAVAPGRLIRSTLVEDGLIVARAHYAGGVPEGERARYELPDAPLFTLPLEMQADLESGTIARLQPTFRWHGYALADDAQITVELAGREWRITGAERMFSVLPADDRLMVYPGRVVQRAIFVEGQLIQTADYQAGRLDGAVTIYRPLGPALFPLDLPLHDALDAGQLAALARPFQQHGHALAADATVTTVIEGGEWFVAQRGPSYTIRVAGAGLTVHPGRVVSRTSYARGLLHGPASLYDDAALLAQQLGYRDGRLDGPMTLYAAGLRQTLITFRAGLRHGPTIAYDEQGRETMVSHYQADQLDGELRLYKDGSLQALATYRGGKQHGPASAYHPSGKPSLVATYADGLLDGESVMHNEQGQIVKTSQYRGGKLDGAVIEYYPSGAVRSHATYHDDKLEGIVYLYDEHGRLKEKSHYRNGEPVGKPERRSWRQSFTQR